MCRSAPMDRSFEQSTHYQAYVFDMFLLHAMLARPGPEYLAKLERMAEFLDAVAGPSGLPPMLGDDDGGQLLLGAIRRPSGPGKRESRLFPDAGIGGDDLRPSTHAVVDAGPFGALQLRPQPFRHFEHRGSFRRRRNLDRPGHLHLHRRSRMARLVSWTQRAQYHSDRWLRSRRDGRAVSVDRSAGSRRSSLATNSERDVLEAECRYAGFTHRRRVEFQKPGVFLINDWRRWAIRRTRYRTVLAPRFARGKIEA